MGGYIGASAGGVANAAERKQTYSITTATTSLTGLAYTPTKVHVFHNGVRLVDGTDYTATNGTSITLTNAAQNGDEVVVISYPSFQTSDTVSAANGGTFAGNVAFSGTTTGLDVNGTDLILDADGDSKIEASTDDTITVHTAGSEAIRIDSSGNVGIGLTAPTAPLTVKSPSNAEAIHVVGRSDDIGQVRFLEADGTTAIGAIDARNSFLGFGSVANIPLQFMTNNNERMRIDTGGRLLVGTTSSTGNAGVLQVKRTSAGASGYFETNGGSTQNIIDIVQAGSSGASQAVRFHNNGYGNIVGSIGFSTTTTSYYTSSDHRLKENVTDITDGITRVKQLDPKRFNFIADADTTVDGFLAHEAQAVVPEAVTGTHNEVDDDGNAVMQGIDQSKLVPLLTAALQEAIAKIETLETQNTTQATQIADLITRVEALEGA